MRGDCQWAPMSPAWPSHSAGGVHAHPTDRVERVSRHVRSAANLKRTDSVMLRSRCGTCGAAA